MVEYDFSSILSCFFPSKCTPFPLDVKLQILWQGLSSFVERFPLAHELAFLHPIFRFFDSLIFSLRLQPRHLFGLPLLLIINCFFIEQHFLVSRSSVPFFLRFSALFEWKRMGFFFFSSLSPTEITPTSLIHLEYIDSPAPCFCPANLWSFPPPLLKSPFGHHILRVHLLVSLKEP